MITIKKLRHLPEDTKIRKVIRLLEMMGHTKSVDFEYLVQLCQIIIESDESRVSQQSKVFSTQLIADIYAKRDTHLLLSDLTYLLATDMGITFGDWDFVDAQDKLDVTKRAVFPFTIVLDRIRSPFNVGSMFRTSDSFGVEKILLSTPCADVDHPRTKRSAAGCTESVDWEKLTPAEVLSSIEGKSVFALEVGGTSIDTFDFPDDGVMVVGSEELGVSPQLLERAKQSLGVVSIPLLGTKGSLNVSTAFSIAMYWWALKKGKLY
jgi:TrmH family RNA methyltransferase